MKIASLFESRSKIFGLQQELEELFDSKVVTTSLSMMEISADSTRNGTPCLIMSINIPFWRPTDVIFFSSDDTCSVYSYDGEVGPRVKASDVGDSLGEWMLSSHSLKLPKRERFFTRLAGFPTLGSFFRAFKVEHKIGMTNRSLGVIEQGELLYLMMQGKGVIVNTMFSEELPIEAKDLADDEQNDAYRVFATLHINNHIGLTNYIIWVEK